MVREGWSTPTATFTKENGKTTYTTAVAASMTSRR